VVAKNKCLANFNKSGMQAKATKKCVAGEFYLGLAHTDDVEGGRTVPPDARTRNRENLCQEMLHV
jgi:hypothetical protein